MKATAGSLRKGDFNEFDRGFQTEMDALIGGTYAAFDKLVRM